MQKWRGAYDLQFYRQVPRPGQHTTYDEGDEFLVWKDLDARPGDGHDFQDVQLKGCLRFEKELKYGRAKTTPTMLCFGGLEKSILLLMILVLGFWNRGILKSYGRYRSIYGTSHKD